MSGADPAGGPEPANGRASLGWLMRGWRGLVVSGALLLGICYVAMGEINDFALALTAFLLIIAAGFEYIPRLSARAVAEGIDPKPAYSRWEGCLGAIWLLSIPFAPLLCWFVFQTVDVNQASWHALFWMRVVLCIVVPAVCVLPLLRYLKRGYVAVQLAVLAIGTGFPALTAIGAAHDLIVGPVWQAVAVERVGTFLHMNRGHGDVEDSDEIMLADRRKLRRAHDVGLDPGPAELLILTGTGRIIAARGQ
ncbi:hypothetical protein [Sphingomonas sp.]|uniref:hypothetical protein n=1 Tax=Sphingomonas sp. TaxID=28214 RepID=UPI003CC6A5FF